MGLDVTVHECRLLGGYKTGEAKITKGYRLPAKYIIRTVGPVWRGGTQREPELLTSCHRRSLEPAESKGVRSIAFPSISTGIFGYPLELPARIAVTTVREFFCDQQTVNEVIFCCVSAKGFGGLLCGFGVTLSAVGKTLRQAQGEWSLGGLGRASALTPTGPVPY